MENPPSPEVHSRMRGKIRWDFRTVDANQLQGYENAIWDIYKRKYDGLLVRNAIPADVCKRLVDNCKDIPQHEVSKVPGGWTVPPIFFEIAQQLAPVSATMRRNFMADYFQRCKRLATELPQYLGVDTHALVHQWLTALGGGMKVDVPRGAGNQGLYAGSTIRAYHGDGQGYFSLQCGNYIQTVSQHFYEHLEGQVDVFDQLSFYFMLQKPERGGELSLFDLEWEEGQSKRTLYENQEVMLPDITVHTVHEGEAQIIDPQHGDLVIFAAGQIWHRLEEVSGNKERMTLGGFAAYSYDKNTLYHWS